MNRKVIGGLIGVSGMALGMVCVVACRKRDVVEVEEFHEIRTQEMELEESVPYRVEGDMLERVSVEDAPRRFGIGALRRSMWEYTRTGQCQCLSVKNNLTAFRGEPFMIRLAIDDEYYLSGVTQVPEGVRHVFVNWDGVYDRQIEKPKHCVKWYNGRTWVECDGSVPSWGR